MNFYAARVQPTSVNPPPIRSNSHPETKTTVPPPSPWRIPLLSHVYNLLRILSLTFSRRNLMTNNEALLKMLWHMP